MRFIPTFLLLMANIVNSQQNCDDYITDEWPNSRYTILTIANDNVVIDNKTALMWKKCTEGLSGIDCTTGKATIHVWQQALALAHTLNNTGYASFTDWRLPNVKELQSITAINCDQPTINETIFPNTNTGLFWTSSPYSPIDHSSWVINFSGGNDHPFPRHVNNYARLVRTK